MANSQLKTIIKRWGVTGILVIGILSGLIKGIENRTKTVSDRERMPKNISCFFKARMEDMYFLLPGYVEKSGEPIEEAKQLLAAQVPVYAYLLEQERKERETEDGSIAKIVWPKEGLDEDYKNIDEEQMDYQKNAMHIENGLMEEMERENKLHNEKDAGAEEIAGENEKVPDGANIQSAKEMTETGPAEEAQTAFAEEKEFEAALYPAYSYDWSENWNEEALVSNFFAVDNSTTLKEEYLNLDRLLYRDLSVDKSIDGPQILIYHTHAHEAFEDSVEGEESTTIVGAGEKLAELLEEEYGFTVLHHKGVYDDVREDAYAQALPAIEQILTENPTIEVVIDLHRDGMSGERKLVMDLQGKPTARFMFFNGLSYTKKGGAISYLENPYIQENLAFSFQAQVAANEYYPGIARKIYLKAYRYNMHLKPKSMLIELGAQNNTVEEIMNACDPLAHILAIVLADVL